MTECDSPLLPARVIHEPMPGRTLTAGLEPLLSIDDLAAILNCSRRLVEQMRSAGKVPPPDLHVGRMPRWKPATIRDWLAQQAEGRRAKP